MKVVRLLSLMLVALIVLPSLVGCKDILDKYPNRVTVTFEPNGGKWLGGSTGNESRDGKEGEYFHLPGNLRYVVDTSYSEEKNETTVHQKQFLGWTLKGGTTVIYNEHDTHGAFPDEDKIYAAKWGIIEQKQESGDTSSNYQ